MAQHRAALTGQQFQSEDNEPYYVLSRRNCPTTLGQSRRLDVG